MFHPFAQDSPTRPNRWRPIASVACFLILGIFSINTVAQAAASTGENPSVGDQIIEGVQIGGQAAGYGSRYGNVNTDFYGYLGFIVETFLGLLGIIFFGLLLYAGFLYLTDEGGGKHVDKAKKMLKSGIIGLVIIIAAYAIANYTIKILQGNTGPTPPTEAPDLGATPPLYVPGPDEPRFVPR
ncbi:hypothetical protein HYV73_03590 [Candidatus Uhrbacteria bacterium]|nr:hypothetical protein [Candidatus Uhrbacteria bacterium]